MQETLQDHHSSISIGGRPICNLRFADDIDLRWEATLTSSETSPTAGKFGMEISRECEDLSEQREQHECSYHYEQQGFTGSIHFIYLEVTLTKNGTSAKEIRITSATAAMTRLNVIWKSNLNLSTKFRLYKSLVVSILLYGCETWTLLAESERRIQTFETRCLSKLLRPHLIHRP
ncbi:putative melanophilin [Apostichopus japonicus]|uniref:Putative melanophilin n=1 Tax=Stichopus japonicus TaxID=307972 RepID=A0A2G8KLP3_STIJA|nr:putative melanophilin [Apostichopus japonicus]